MCGRYLAYANVTRLCHACYVTPDESDDPFHKCKFISMTDVNLKCLAALQLYKPEEYGIGINLQRFSDLEIKEQNWKLMKNSRSFLSTCI